MGVTVIVRAFSVELAISPMSFQSRRMGVTVTHGYYPVRLQLFLISHCMLVKLLSRTILGLMCINVSLFIEFAAIIMPDFIVWVFSFGNSLSYESPA